MPNNQGEFIWYELITPRSDSAESFYGPLLGWEFGNGGQAEIDYRIITATESSSGSAVPVGGVLQMTPEMRDCGVQPGWLGYISVDDVDAIVSAVESSGGVVHMPATDIPHVGRIALLSDPQGATFYVMRSAIEEPSQAFAADRPRPGHCAWNELSTSDPNSAWHFYSRHFGWTKDSELDMGPMGAYEFIRHGGVIGAMMPQFEETPVPVWHYYFRVDNIDKALEQIPAAGGSLIHGPDEIPGGDFILKGFDPDGALFALVGAGGQSPRGD